DAAIDRRAAAVVGDARTRKAEGRAAVRVVAVIRRRGAAVVRGGRRAEADGEAVVRRIGVVGEHVVGRVVVEVVVTAVGHHDREGIVRGSCGVAGGSNVVVLAVVRVVVEVAVTGVGRGDGDAAVRG